MTNLFVIAGVAAIGAVMLFAARTQALDTAPLSETHKQRIVANCTSAKASLQQLHRSDASLRLNRGQLYEFISTKLMARLNSRIALNRLDGTELVAAAVRYERALNDFRERYRLYEEQLSAVLRINCSKQPEVFYYQVQEVREKRRSVGDVTDELEKYIVEYYEVFERFSHDYTVALKGVTQ